VSLDAIRAFKLVTHHEVDAIFEAMRRLLPGLTERQCNDLIATATAVSGAFWQMANPGPEVAALYDSDPGMLPFPMLHARLRHPPFEIEPLLRRVLTAMLKGMLGQ